MADTTHIWCSVIQGIQSWDVFPQHFPGQNV